MCGVPLDCRGGSPHCVSSLSIWLMVGLVASTLLLAHEGNNKLNKPSATQTWGDLNFIS